MPSHAVYHNVNCISDAQSNHAGLAKGQHHQTGAAYSATAHLRAVYILLYYMTQKYLLDWTSVRWRNSMWKIGYSLSYIWTYCRMFTLNWMTKTLAIAILGVELQTLCA